MGEEVLVSPLIKRKPGECTVCGYPIGVLTSELTDIALNQEGLPIRYQINSYRTIGYCSHCGATYPNIAHRGIYFDIRGGPLYDYINNVKDEGGCNDVR